MDGMRGTMTKGCVSRISHGRSITATQGAATAEYLAAAALAPRQSEQIRPPLSFLSASIGVLCGQVCSIRPRCDGMRSPPR